MSFHEAPAVDEKCGLVLSGRDQQPGIALLVDGCEATLDEKDRSLGISRISLEDSLHNEGPAGEVLIPVSPVNLRYDFQCLASHFEAAAGRLLRGEHREEARSQQISKGTSVEKVDGFADRQVSAVELVGYAVGVR